MDKNITYTPIGWVENGFDEPTPMELIRVAESLIVLKPEYTPGLDGLKPGDKLLVLFHFHLSHGFDLTQHPRRDLNRPKRGVFSLCSPQRPNPVGATVVDLIEINGNRLKVIGLDAINQTPVIDLKPFNSKKEDKNGEAKWKK